MVTLSMHAMYIYIGMKILEKDMLKSLDSVRLALVVLKPLLPTVVKEVGKSINGEAVKAMARLIWVSLLVSSYYKLHLHFYLFTMY